MASLVERATNDMLIGPDWAKNLEICDVINGDPGLTKDVIKTIKKRLANKNPKVQFLTLMVLETIVKNCGDVVHQQVAERDVLHEMVKIVKKQRDPQVTEKTLVLLDAWQAAFGGPGGRYPQYFMAYDELRRSGVMFPKRAENAASIFTPIQTQPISTYPPLPSRSSTHVLSGAETSTASNMPVMSLMEIQTARSSVEVLTDMLNALDPQNKQALQNDLIMELVEQCQIAEQRVMQLVSSTSDEELLCQGLSLNDELQRVFAKHAAFASGSGLTNKQTPTTPPAQLINIDHEQEEAEDVLSQLSQRSSSRPHPQNLRDSDFFKRGLPPPPQPQKSIISPPATHDPSTDLLSGDSYDKLQTPTLLSSITEQHIQPQRAPSEQNIMNPFDSNPSFQGSTSVPAYTLSSQHQSHLQLSDTKLVQPYQSNDQQLQLKMQPQIQEPHHLQETNTEPWINSSGQSLSPQQQALIYGLEKGTQSIQSLQDPQQPAVAYNSQSAALPPVVWPSYSSQLQHQKIYGVSDIDNPQTSVPLQQQSQQNFNSPLSQSSETFSTPQQPIQHHLPPAPWSTEVGQNMLSSNQQEALQYVSTMAPSLPQSPAQFPQREQYLQQQHVASGQMSSMDNGQLNSPYGVQANLLSQMQNISLQGESSYYMPRQTLGQDIRQFEFPPYQQQVRPLRKEKPEDKLFKDLVDFAKLKNTGTPNK
eukprot:c29219_g1_i2 orf=212-2317(-)